jgi:hypothetical protein
MFGKGTPQQDFEYIHTLKAEFVPPGGQHVTMVSNVLNTWDKQEIDAATEDLKKDTQDIRPLYMQPLGVQLMANFGVTIPLTTQDPQTLLVKERGFASAKSRNPQGSASMPPFFHSSVAYIVDATKEQLLEINGRMAKLRESPPKIQIKIETINVVKGSIGRKEVQDRGPAVELQDAAMRVEMTRRQIALTVLGGGLSAAGLTLASTLRGQDKIQVPYLETDPALEFSNNLLDQYGVDTYEKAANVAGFAPKISPYPTLELSFIDSHGNKIAVASQESKDGLLSFEINNERVVQVDPNNKALKFTSKRLLRPSPYSVIVRTHHGDYLITFNEPHGSIFEIENIDGFPFKNFAKVIEKSALSWLVGGEDFRRGYKSTNFKARPGPVLNVIHKAITITQSIPFVTGFSWYDHHFYVSHLNPQNHFAQETLIVFLDTGNTGLESPNVVRNFPKDFKNKLGLDSAMNIMTVAQNPYKSDLGGIDMNAANLNLQIKRDGRGVPLSISQQDLEHIHLEGLVPIILDIKPANNLPIFTELQNSI